MDRNERMETIYLSVKLTPTEVMERAKEAAQLDLEHREAESFEKSRAKSAKERIADMDARLSTLNTAVRTGEEPRPVECEWGADLMGRQMILRRTDTAEVVRSRPMSESEREQWAQGDLISYTEQRAREAAVRAAIEEQQRQAERMRPPTTPVRINGLAVGDRVTLGDLNAVVSSVTDGGFGWKSAATETRDDGTTVDVEADGFARWDAVEHIGGEVWGLRSSPAPKHRKAKAQGASATG